MASAVSVELDERVGRFIEYLQKSKRITSLQATGDLLMTGYHQHVRRLHGQYLQGEITLRRMAKELGLEFRQLYHLLEELHLPLA